MVKRATDRPHRRHSTSIRATRHFPSVSHSASSESESYDRARHLPGLIPLWPHEIADMSRDGRLTILHRLRFALRAERQRGRSGHWSYDLNRHMGLIQAYKAELATLSMPGQSMIPKSGNRFSEKDHAQETGRNLAPIPSERGF